MVHNAGPASSGRPHQEVTLVDVCGVWRRSLPAPIVDSVHGQGDIVQRNAAQEAAEKVTVERALSACRYAGAVKVASCTLLAELRPAGNEETSATVVTKSSSITTMPFP